MKNPSQMLENTVFNPTLVAVIDFYGIPEYRF